MRLGFRLMAGLLTAATVSSAAMGQSTADASTHQRMASAGFIPLEEMTFGGREVHRVLLIDPYGFLPIPGIELERHGDGRLTLRAQYHSWTGPAYAVTQAEWDRLAALEPLAYAPPGKSSFKAKAGVVVHCWSGLLEASPGKAASWWACNSGTQAARDYTNAVLELAMEKMSCAENDDTLWRFSECSAVSYKLDDPALQQRLVTLREQWTKQREAGSDILATARVALRTARENSSPPVIAKAREAVLAFGRQQAALQAILQSSFGAFPKIDEAGGKNAALVAETQLSWQRDIEAQNRNYIGLLEELTQLPSGVTTKGF